MLQRPLRQRSQQRPDAVRNAAEHGVRERDGPLEPGAPDELDGLVHRRVLGHAVEVGELVRAEPQRGEDGRVELSDGPLAERLDRVVERPYALDSAVRELAGERPVALVEALGRAPQRPVGVRLLLEHAPQHLVGRAAGR